MKKFVIYLISSSILLVSCKSTRLVPFSDDVYADPIEEKRIAKANAEAQKKKEMEEEAAKQAAYAAQKAQDDANPYYKDPNYSSDDYYDYAYAAQIKRFHNPIYGTGYYDDYYTNSYWYNQNPACYGNSIYNGYNWWPNSPYMNYGYGNCWNNNFGYNNLNNPYNPYFGGWNNGVSVGLGYSNFNPYWNSPFCNYGMQYYGMYGNYGYNNPYWNNNNWGYFNSFDNNSNYTYAPRTGNAGSNSRNETFAGMKVQNGDNERVRFINQMVEVQESTPKFTNIERKVSNTPTGGNFQPAGNNGAIKTMGNNETNNGNVRNSGTYTPNNNNGGYNTNQNNTSVKQQPVKQPNKTSTNSNTNTNPAPVKINNNNFNTGNNEGFIRGGNSGGSSSGGSSGGSSSPRNSGGGGTSKPR